MAGVYLVNQQSMKTDLNVVLMTPQPLIFKTTHHPFYSHGNSIHHSDDFDDYFLFFRFVFNILQLPSNIITNIILYLHFYGKNHND